MNRVSTTFAAVLLVVATASCAAQDYQGEPYPGLGTPAATAPPAPPKPRVEVPEGEPPSELVVEDVRVGSGPEVSPGDLVLVHYVGVAWSTKEEFGSSYDTGQPQAVQLTEGQLIQGWVEGVPGMKVGGMRKLIIPPDKGYGSAGQGPIAPDETLVFMIEVIDARTA